MERNSKDGSDSPRILYGLARVDEVAQTLGISVRSVARLLAAGTLPKVKCGRATRIPRRAIEEFIRSGGTSL